MEIINKYIDNEIINWTMLESLLRQSFPEIPDEQMTVKKYNAGYSNLTYLISFGDWEAVLRRPPFGYIPPKAHDMKREYTILKKISAVYPHAPAPYLFIENQDIMDKQFYVMEKKQGITLDDKIPEQYISSVVAGPIISNTIVHALAELHSIDIYKSNLSDIGKPAGYLERQVQSWIKRYKNSQTDDHTGVAQLEAWFIKNQPTSREATIVHNDFKLNNLLFDENEPSLLRGVLDWELSTVGDPLTDLGSTVAYWGEPRDPYLGINIITDQQGFFSRRDFVEAYAKQSGRDVTNINYYVAFGFYKLAVILQQIYYRWKLGEIDDDRFKHLNQAVANLMEMADLTRRNHVI